MSDRQSSSRNRSLEYLFHPRSIAIAGVSRKLDAWNHGQMYLNSLLNCGFRGRLYPLNPGGGEISGLTIYRNIREVPDNVDYVISAIPARFTPKLIADCAAKGVKAIHMFTAGFSELGNDHGRRLEQEVTGIARKHGIRLIGPNGMGLHYAKTGLAFRPDAPRQAGTASFISQSGGNSMYAIREGVLRGLYFNKVISLGNASDLNEADFLEYLIDDPETTAIAIYIEGVKEGQRFLQVLRRAARIKPVVIYKGGITESGSRATASHTGSIAGSAVIWSSLIKQTGAIEAHSIEEINDIMLLLTMMSPPSSKNIAIVGMGGGASVLAADICSSAGLTVPAFPAELRQQLVEITAAEAGSSFHNPVDIFGSSRSGFRRAIQLIAGYPLIDRLIIHIPFGYVTDDQVRFFLEFVKSITKIAPEINRRTVIVLHSTTSPANKQAAQEAAELLYEAGFAVYSSLDRAARALSQFLHYHHID